MTRSSIFVILTLTLAAFGIGVLIGKAPTPTTRYVGSAFDLIGMGLFIGMLLYLVVPPIFDRRKTHRADMAQTGLPRAETAYEAIADAAVAIFSVIMLSCGAIWGKPGAGFPETIKVGTLFYFLGTGALAVIPLFFVFDRIDARRAERFRARYLAKRATPTDSAGKRDEGTGK